jgi:nickel superoxide dismutase
MKMKRGKITNSVLMTIFILVLVSPQLESHCQIPCGIYNDQMRITMIREHITTIEKAMNQVSMLSGEENPNYNQLIRWITNKEKHAEEMSGIITDYFLAQRVNPVPPEEGKAYSLFQKRLELLHRLMVLTMKSKQGIDLSIINKMRATVKNFEKIYFLSD